MKEYVCTLGECPFKKLLDLQTGQDSRASRLHHQAESAGRRNDNRLEKQYETEALAHEEKSRALQSEIDALRGVLRCRRQGNTSASCG